MTSTTPAMSLAVRVLLVLAAVQLCYGWPDSFSTSTRATITQVDPGTSLVTVDGFPATVTMAALSGHAAFAPCLLPTSDPDPQNLKCLPGATPGPPLLTDNACPTVTWGDITPSDEFFYWIAALEIKDTAGSGLRVRCEAGFEGAFLSGAPCLGEQQVFARFRYKLTGAKPGATYTLYTPWGTADTEAADSTGVIYKTEDHFVDPNPGQKYTSNLSPLLWPLVPANMQPFPYTVGGYLPNAPLPFTGAPAPEAGIPADCLTGLRAGVGRNCLCVKSLALSSPLATDQATITGRMATVPDPPGLSTKIKAMDDTFTIPPDTPTEVDVLANDVGITPTMSVILIAPPAKATATVTAQGRKITYTPVAGSTAPDSFTYAVVDGNSLSNTAIINIIFGSAPVPTPAQLKATPDTVSVSRAVDTTLRVLVNDMVPSTGVKLEVTKSPTLGTATVDSTNSFITYSPDHKSDGQDTLEYTISSGGSRSSAAVTLPSASKVTITDVKFTVSKGDWGIKGSASTDLATGTMAVVCTLTGGVASIGNGIIGRNANWEVKVSSSAVIPRTIDTTVTCGLYGVQNTFAITRV